MIKVGIIGCGKQGEKHANALNALPNIELFVEDINHESAKELAGKYLAVATNDVFSYPIDALIICTPTKYHFEKIKLAFEKNIHVFCEKPLVSTQEEFTQLKDLHKKSQSKLFVGFVYKFSPTIQQIHNLCQENKELLGKPIHAIFRIGGRGDHQLWKHTDKSGGVVNEMLVHMLDLCHWFLGDYNINQVIAKKCMKPLRNINGKSYKVDKADFITLSASSKNGAEILFQADFVTKKFSQYFEIVFENGSCFGSITSDFEPYFFLQGKEQKKIEEQKNVNLFLNQIQYFINCVSDKNPKQEINTLRDYTKIDNLIEQIQQGNK